MTTNSSNVKPSDKSKPNKDGVVAIDNSINSLVNFLDKLLKCIHDTLDQLENYYQAYTSAVQTGMELNIIGKASNEQKKIDSKYHFIRTQLEEFLTCIVQDYGDIIQDAYEIRSLQEKYDSHINYLKKVSLDDNQLDGLDTLIPKVEKMKKQIDKLVLQYNAEVTKLTYLKLNLQYRIIVYRSSFTGQSFSIPINVLIRNFKNLIQSNKLVVIANEIHTSLLEQPLTKMQTLSQEPELIYARSVNLDPLLINTTIRKSKLSSSFRPPKPDSSPGQPPQAKRPKRESPETKPSTQESTQQEPLAKLPRGEPSQQEPSQVETSVSDMTTPVAKPLETGQSTKESTRLTSPMVVDLSSTGGAKRKANSAILEDVESPSLEVDKSDKSEIKRTRKDSSDEAKSTVESEIDVTNAEGPEGPEDTSSMPSLRDELLEAERLNAPSSSSSPIQPPPRKSIMKRRFKQRLEQKRKQSSRKIPMKVKKPDSKRYAPAKPIPELIAIDKQDVITQEFYDNTYGQLQNRIDRLEIIENEEIVLANNDLCKKYHIIQRQLNNVKKDLKSTESKVEKIRKSGAESEEVQEDLRKKEEMIDKFKTNIVQNELKIRRIQYLVQKLDKQDYDMQIYKNILYDIQRHLCQRWLEQLNKSLATETDTDRLLELRTNIRKVKRRIEKIFFEIKDLHPGYLLRKKRRMISGPYRDNFCTKTIANLDMVGRKYAGKDYQPDMTYDPLPVGEEEPARKPAPSAPTNILIPKRKPQ